MLIGQIIYEASNIILYIPEGYGTYEELTEALETETNVTSNNSTSIFTSRLPLLKMSFLFIGYLCCVVASTRSVIKLHYTQLITTNYLNKLLKKRLVYFVSCVYLCLRSTNAVSYTHLVLEIFLFVYNWYHVYPTISMSSTYDIISFHLFLVLSSILNCDM